MNKTQSYKIELSRQLAKFSSAKEWSDFIGLLSGLEKIINKYNSENSRMYLVCIPSVVKRLSQCMNSVLPNGVHARALEVFRTIFEICEKSIFNKIDEVEKIHSALVAAGRHVSEEKELAVVKESEVDRILNQHADVLFLLENFNLITCPLFDFGIHCRILVNRQYLMILENYIVPISQLIPQHLPKIITAILPSMESEQSDFYESAYRLMVVLFENYQKNLNEIADQTHLNGFYYALYTVFIEHEYLRSSAINFINKHNKPDFKICISSYEIMVKAVCLGLTDSAVYVVRNILETLHVDFPLKLHLEEKVVSEPKEISVNETVGSESIISHPKYVTVIKENPLLEKMRGDSSESCDLIRKRLIDLNIKTKISILNVLLKRESSLNKKVYKIFDIDRSYELIVETLKYFLSDSFDHFLIRRHEEAVETFYKCVHAIAFRENCIDLMLDKYLIRSIYLTKRAVEQKVTSGSIPLEEISGLAVFKESKITVNMNIKATFRVFYNCIIENDDLNCIVNLLSFVLNQYEIIDNYTVKIHLFIITREIIKKKLFIDVDVLDNYMKIFYNLVESEGILINLQKTPPDSEITAVRSVIEQFYTSQNKSKEIEEINLLEYLSLEVYNLENYERVEINRGFHNGTSIFYKGISNLREENGILELEENVGENYEEHNLVPIFIKSDILFIQNFYRRFQMQFYKADFYRELKNFLLMDYRHKYLINQIIIRNSKLEISTSFFDILWTDFITYNNPFYLIEYDCECFLISKIDSFFLNKDRDGEFSLGIKKVSYLLETAMQRNLLINALYNFFIRIKQETSVLNNSYLLEEMLSHYHILVQNINSPTEIFMLVISKVDEIIKKIVEIKDEDTLHSDMKIHLDLIDDLLQNNYTIRIIKENVVINYYETQIGLKIVFSRILSNILEEMMDYSNKIINSDNNVRGNELVNNNDVRELVSSDNTVRELVSGNNDVRELVSNKLVSNNELVSGKELVSNTDDSQLVSNELVSGNELVNNKLVSNNELVSGIDSMSEKELIINTTNLTIKPTNNNINNNIIAKTLIQKVLKIFHTLFSNGVELQPNLDLHLIVLAHINNPLIVTYCLGMLEIRFILSKLMHYYKIVLYQINMRGIFSSRKLDMFYSLMVDEGENLFISENGKFFDVSLFIKVWKESYKYIKTNQQISLNLYYNRIIECFIEKSIEYSTIEYRNTTLVFNSDFTKLNVIGTNTNDLLFCTNPFESNFISSFNLPYKSEYSPESDHLVIRQQKKPVNSGYSITVSYKNTHLIGEFASFSSDLIRDNLPLFITTLPKDISIIPFFYSLDYSSKGLLYKEMVGKYNSYVLMMLYDDFDVILNGKSGMTRSRGKILNELKIKYSGKLSEIDLLCLLRLGLFDMDKTIFTRVISTIENNTYNVQILRMLYCVILNNQKYFKDYRNILFSKLHRDPTMFNMIYSSIMIADSSLLLNKESLLENMVNSIYFYHKHSFSFYNKRKALSISFAENIAQHFLEDSFFTFAVEQKSNIFYFLSSYIDHSSLMATLFSGMGSSFFSANLIHKTHNLRRISFSICSSPTNFYDKFSDSLVNLIHTLLSSSIELKIELYKLIRVILFKMDHFKLRDIFPTLLEDMHSSISTTNFKLLFSVISCVDVSLFMDSKEFKFSSVIEAYNNIKQRMLETTITIEDKTVHALGVEHQSTKFKSFFNYKAKSINQINLYCTNALAYYSSNKNLVTERDYDDLQRKIIKQFEEKRKKQ
ncbi:pad-1 [Nucleospora cyclopteri]